MSPCLGDLVDIVGGGTPSKSVPEYWRGSIPWASVKDFKTSELVTTDDYITELGVKNSSTRVIPAGNIIVPTRMALGKVAVNRVDMAINQDLKALLVKDDSRLYKPYLLRFLESKAKKIEGHGKGATVKGITLNVLRELEIPLPPLAEQKRIAAILDKADAIRRKRQQAIQLADEFLRATFLDMFGDPVTNPKGWVFKKIKDVTKDWRGGAPFKPEDFESEGIPVLHKGAIQKNGIVLVDPKKKAFTSVEFSEKYKKSEVTSDFTAVTLRDLVPIGPSIGLISNLKYANRGRYILAQGAYGFLVKSEQVNSDYLVYLSNNVAFRSQLRKYWVGSTQIHIRTPIFQNMKIPIPPIEMQNKFAEVVNKLYTSINKYHTAMKELNDFFQSSSQKAFSGEL